MHTLHQYQHLFGLIGYPLSHSFSKKYFGEKFAREGITDCYYELFPIERIEELPAILEAHPNLRGLNVTIPYKEAVFDYLDEVEAGARAVGAVNVIRIRDGKLSGYNSDVYGFSESLAGFLAEHDRHPAGALILGTGGAAKAVRYVLDRQKIPFRLVSRIGGKDRLTYDQITPEILREYSLIINTTPLGMSPQIGTFPDIPYHYLQKENLLYDLVYNPELTTFMRKGTERGCPTKNGLEMLYLQAEKAWEIWRAEG